MPHTLKSVPGYKVLSISDVDFIEGFIGEAEELVTLHRTQSRALKIITSREHTVFLHTQLPWCPLCQDRTCESFSSYWSQLSCLQNLSQDQTNTFVNIPGQQTLSYALFHTLSGKAARKKRRSFELPF